MLPSRIHAFRPLVDLQSCRHHLSVLQELQRHPYEMTFDTVQLLPHLRGWNHAVEDMARLGALSREKHVVVVESFDWKTGKESAWGGESRFNHISVPLSLRILVNI